MPCFTPKSFRICALLLLAAFPRAAEAGNRYLHSALEFKWHMEAHIERLPDLAVYLKKAYPADFTDVNEAQLRDFLLRCHDQSKINQSYEFLRRFGQEEKPPIYRSLWERLYGKGLGRMSGSRKRKALGLVKELNRIDNQVALDWFSAHGMLDSSGKVNALGQKFLLLEKVADGVDRSMFTISRYEEWGREMVPAHRFYSNPKMKAYATKLESAYWKIVDPYSFERMKERKLAAHAQARCLAGRLQPASRRQ